MCQARPGRRCPGYARSRIASLKTKEKALSSKLDEAVNSGDAPAAASAQKSIDNVHKDMSKALTEYFETDEGLERVRSNSPADFPKLYLSSRAHKFAGDVARKMSSPRARATTPAKGVKMSVVVEDSGDEISSRIETPSSVKFTHLKYGAGEEVTTTCNFKVGGDKSYSLDEFTVKLRTDTGDLSTYDVDTASGIVTSHVGGVSTVNKPTMTTSGVRYEGVPQTVLDEIDA